MNQEDLEKHRFNEHHFEFVGAKIHKALYFEIDYEDDQAHFEQSKNVHVLDYALGLETDNEKQIFLEADESFECYGLALREDPIQNLQSAKVHDVSKDKPWGTFLPAVITRISIYWYSTGYEDSPPFWPRPFYPLDMEIEFASTHCFYLSSRNYNIDSDDTSTTDDVFIVWNEDCAEKYKVGKYGNHIEICSKQL